MATVKQERVPQALIERARAKRHAKQCESLDEEIRLYFGHLASEMDTDGYKGKGASSFVATARAMCECIYELEKAMTPLASAGDGMQDAEPVPVVSHSQWKQPAIGVSGREV